MSEEDNLGNVLFEWATNSEFQAIFLVGCTCVGIWVLIKWIMQVLYGKFVSSPSPYYLRE